MKEKQHAGLVWGNHAAFFVAPEICILYMQKRKSDRCYRKALSWSQCLDELDKNRSKMYDPEVVDAAFVCQAMIFNALRAD